MIVVDASAMVELLLRTSSGGRVDLRLKAPGEAAFAPHLIDIEVAHVLRRLALRREIEIDRSEMALTDFLDVRMVRYPHSWMLTRIWELRDNLSVYDASYVVLAEALDAPLLTCDRRLAASTGHRARIESV